MVSTKKLAYYLSQNTLSRQQIQQQLEQFKWQEYRHGMCDAYDKSNMQKRKRKMLLDTRIKHEWDKVITQLRDQLSKS